MIPRKFVAATSREALYKVREALGEEAIILSNKQVPGGVEIIAVSEHEMDAFAHEAHTHTQEAANFASPEWPRYPEPGIGAAAHYQHWQTVSWNAYADEEPEWQPEPEPERSAVPMSSLNDYWHNQQHGQAHAASGKPAASAPLPMAVPQQPGAPGWMVPPAPAPVHSSPRKEHVSAASAERRSAQSPNPQSGQRERAMMSEPQSGMNARMGGERGADRLPNAMPTPPSHSAHPAHQSHPSHQPHPSFPSKAPAPQQRAADDRQRNNSGLRPASSPGAPPLRTASKPASAADARGENRSHQGSTGGSGSSSGSVGAGRSVMATHEEPAIQHELKLLRSLLEGQLAGFAWNELSQRSPLHLTLMRWMLSAGFSPILSREILEDLSGRQDITEAMGQIRKQLSQRIACMSAEDDIIDRGGVYALVGTTGVGKTTTVAKLAARCTLKHGPQHVALLTTDSYRIGAHDQLKAYGRILSVPVYGIRDETDLVSALNDLSTRRLILIDTIGMSQRDRRLVEQIALLGRQGGNVQQLLVVAANAQASTLEDVVRAYGSSQLTGVIISKMDETCQIGSVVDMLIRHQLRVCYLTDGQRVPEDLHLPQAKTLVDRAFQDILSESPLALNENEYPLIWK